MIERGANVGCEARQRRLKSLREAVLVTVLDRKLECNEGVVK
jgi:hypothetical protein